MVTSKRILRVELTPELKAQIRRLPKRQRKQIGDVITAVRDGFGAPHLHSGLSIRRLRQNYFECRVGLDIRLAFRVERNRMIFVAAGNHDEIRKVLKTL